MNVFFKLNGTSVCQFNFNSIDFNNYMFVMITLGLVQNITYEILTKLTKMLSTFVKQF